MSLLKGFFLFYFKAIFKCPHLRSLALKNCFLLTGEVFHHMPHLTKLKKLKMTRAINLKPEDFQYVFSAESAQTIEDLDLNGSWGVGEIGLKAITTRLTKLKHLSLKNCKTIKGEDVALLLNLQKLISLNVAHTLIDSNDILLLPQYTKTLKKLVVGSEIPKRTIQQLKKYLTGLSVVVSFSEFHKDERLLNDLN